MMNNYALIGLRRLDTNFNLRLFLTIIGVFSILTIISYIHELSRAGLLGRKQKPEHTLNSDFVQKHRFIRDVSSHVDSQHAVAKIEWRHNTSTTASTSRLSQISTKEVNIYIQSSKQIADQKNHNLQVVKKLDSLSKDVGKIKKVLEDKVVNKKVKQSKKAQNIEKNSMEYKLYLLHLNKNKSKKISGDLYLPNYYTHIDSILKEDRALSGNRLFIQQVIRSLETTYKQSRVEIFKSVAHGDYTQTQTGRCPIYLHAKEHHSANHRKIESDTYSWIALVQHPMVKLKIQCQFHRQKDGDNSLCYGISERNIHTVPNFVRYIYENSLFINILYITGLYSHIPYLENLVNQLEFSITDIKKWDVAVATSLNLIKHHLQDWFALVIIDTNTVDINVMSDMHSSLNLSDLVYGDKFSVCDKTLHNVIKQFYSECRSGHKLIHADNVYKELPGTKEVMQSVKILEVDMQVYNMFLRVFKNQVNVYQSIVRSLV